jgi:type VI secretion system ImpC/EvpB family protein
VLGGGESAQRFEFRTFDDFHPQALLENRVLFGRLLDLRARLQNPGTFADALEELGAEAAATPADSIQPEGEGTASTLERLLGQRPDMPPADARGRAVSTVDALIRRVVAPYVVAPQDAQVPQLVSAVDTAMGDVMRRVLHDPGFQSVEATWRALHWLVSTLELGDDLELHLLHVTRDELSQGVGPDSGLYQRLAEREARMAGGLRFAALIGNYQFGASADDLDVLESIGGLARALDAPFVAEARASLLGSSSVAEHADPREWTRLNPELEQRWHSLRSAPSATYLGLALPRFLLRMPYGRRSDPIERFAFEEMTAPPEHESFLWGNPAFACAVVLARSQQDDADLTEAGDLGGLPAFVSGTDDEARVEPCAETWLSDTAVDAVLARGIMPLVSIKNRDVVRLIRLQSIADPPGALGG